ncbi:hypothetical protein, partial [Algoriphagus sp. A40]|uniref:hypothetical protein n=1 Tax=Algoriphagus sp. A40 TaxID=1945863 RepID=UPI0009CADB83
YLDSIILNRHNVTQVAKKYFSKSQIKDVLFIHFESKILSGSADLVQYSLPNNPFPVELSFISTNEIFSLVFETSESDLSKAKYFADFFHNKSKSLIKEMFDKIDLLNNEIRKFNLKNSFKLAQHLSLKGPENIELDFREFYHYKNPSSDEQNTSPTGDKLLNSGGWNPWKKR